MQLNELRKELRFNTELVQLIGTLKNIAAGQYHLMEKEKRRFEAFMTAFASFFRVVDLVRVEDPLVREMSDVLGIVVVTSDSGFMGGLNQGVIRAALRCQGALSNQKTHLVVIGDKGVGVMSDMRRDFKYFRGIDQSTLYEQAVEVRDYVVGEVLARRLGRVVVVYPRPVSFTAQTIETISLLPCSQLFDRDADSEVSRRAGGGAFLAEARKVIVESSFTSLVEYLASLWVASRLFEVFEDSKLAEFSARAMHLEESLQKIEKTKKRIQHLVFKATHERIDKGMRESFSAGRTRRRRGLVAA
jgi:ATP synthase F1 gamma subunit